jgi:hypothetical protein
VCPHGDFHRLLKRAFVPRLPASAGATPHRVNAARPRGRKPLRALLVFVTALLAIGGCVSLRESGLETRPGSLSSHHWLGSADVQPNPTPDNEAACMRYPTEARALRTRTNDRFTLVPATVFPA